MVGLGLEELGTLVEASFARHPVGVLAARVEDTAGWVLQRRRRVARARVQTVGALPNVEAGVTGLTVNLYFRGELVMMLERAGFTDVRVRGEYNDLEPTTDDHFLVYVATRA